MLEQLADVYAPIAADLRRVDRMLRDELRADLPCVDELCAHVERFRGKMLRPAVLMMCGQAAGRVGPEHHTLAAVVEMVHLATLVHDDVLDDADLRRNLPAVNRRWGTESAVLLGDYLFSHAFHLCSSLESQFASQRIGATARRLCEGELLQIAHRGRFDLDEATYFEIIARKTASLTETSAVLGARYAGADDAAVDQLARYGRSLGMAFQIADDLLDLTGETRELGKPVGRDVDQGEVTLPVIRHLQTASPAQRAAMLAVQAPQRVATPTTKATAPPMTTATPLAAACARCSANPTWTTPATPLALTSPRPSKASPTCPSPTPATPSPPWPSSSSCAAAERVSAIAAFTIGGADGDVVVTINGPFVETHDE
jgi:octaprenyl-diphosphate synthase